MFDFEIMDFDIAFVIWVGGGGGGAAAAEAVVVVCVDKSLWHLLQ